MKETSALPPADQTPGGRAEANHPPCPPGMRGLPLVASAQLRDGGVNCWACGRPGARQWETVQPARTGPTTRRLSATVRCEPCDVSWYGGTGNAEMTGQVRKADRYIDHGAVHVPSP